MIIHSESYPRAGLIGNPSDGYFGKTIAFTFENFRAEVTLYETPELEILPNNRDSSCFSSIGQLVSNVRDFGYYGGIRLLKAAVKKFHDYCTTGGIQLHERNFTIRYNSDIPHRVGLAGSSAIITACMRALMSFYQVDIPKPMLATLILAVENDELQISAGLQDRVAQVYEGLVYMDFNREVMEKQKYGIYKNLDPNSLPPLYIAYLKNGSEGSEVFHNNIRDRFQRREPEVLNAMKFWADLTEQVKESLLKKQHEEIRARINSNFDMRENIYRISEANRNMVKAARSAGASAKFSGSGGAIVGTYEDDKMLERLKRPSSRLTLK
jgi:glucuronokinase